MKQSRPEHGPAGFVRGTLVHGLSRAAAVALSGALIGGACAGDADTSSPSNSPSPSVRADEGTSPTTRNDGEPPAASGVATTAASDPGATAGPPDSAPSAGPVDGGPESAGDTGVPPADGGGEGQQTSALAVPAAGRYRFHVSGTETGAAPSGRVDESSDQVVERVSGTTVRLTDDSQVVRLEYRPGVIHLTELDITVPGFNRRFVAAPPVLYAPYPAESGRSWQWRLKSTDPGTNTSITQESVARGVEQIKVAGAVADTFVVETLVTFSGDANGTVRLTTWTDPARGLAVRVHRVTDLTIGLYRAKGDVTAEFMEFTGS